MRRLLMVAYHFPPLAGSSGIQRTLRFMQHLPSMGWQPLVLTASTGAYERVSQDLLGEVPADTLVRRALAFDTARHLQIKGRYAAWMARPDRWASWRFMAVREGMKLIREYKPDAIWSTYPIATAHVIGAALHQQSGIPWFADFRDPMAQDGYPADPRTWASYLRVEARAARHARYCVFTTPGAMRMYQERYPEAADRMVVIENGYHEESFAAASPASPADEGSERPENRPLLMLHSGIVYPSERDPTHLFMALGKLKTVGSLNSTDLRIRFRASEHDAMLLELAREHGAGDFIEVVPPIAYREALSEMMSVDALLVMQAANCNSQIPAKVYEYLRAGRPILGLTDPVGDTAGVLRRAGVTAIARLDSVSEIADALISFVLNWRRSSLAGLQEQAVKNASRHARSAELVALLDKTIISPGHALGGM